MIIQNFIHHDIYLNFKNYKNQIPIYFNIIKFILNFKNSLKLFIFQNYNLIKLILDFFFYYLSMNVYFEYINIEFLEQFNCFYTILTFNFMFSIIQDLKPYF